MFIDLKLNYMNEQERDIQKMFDKPSTGAKKGKEFETMPFFLSDEFKTILEDKIRGTGGPSDKLGETLGGTSAGLNMTGSAQ